MKTGGAKAPSTEPRRENGGTVRALCRLGLAVVMYALLAVAVPLALWAAFQALFGAWNLSAETVSRAPGWARLIYRWHGGLITLLSDLLIIALCRRMNPVRPEKPDGGKIARGWLAGAGMALLPAAVFLASDSLRLSWPLSRPHVTVALAAMWLLNGLGAAAEAFFLLHVLYDAIRERWGHAAALAGAALAGFAFIGGLGGGAIAAVNVLLMYAVYGLMYRSGGLWLPLSFRWGWGFASAFLLGQGGGEGSVYRLYGVSEGLLTGGDAGFVNGLCLTAILVGWLAFLVARGGFRFRRPRMRNEVW